MKLFHFFPQQNKLGLLDKDEMFTSQMIDIMSHVQGYCPKTADGQIQKIPFGGDGMSVIKSASAQRGRADHFTDEERLSGLIPKPEDWHEGCIVLQVSDIVLFHWMAVRDSVCIIHLMKDNCGSPLEMNVFTKRIRDRNIIIQYFRCYCASPSNMVIEKSCHSYCILNISEFFFSLCLIHLSSV